MVYQTAWKQDGVVAGLFEISSLPVGGMQYIRYTSDSRNAPRWGYKRPAV